MPIRGTCPMRRSRFPKRQRIWRRRVIPLLLIAVLGICASTYAPSNSLFFGLSKAQWRLISLSYIYILAACTFVHSYRLKRWVDSVLQEGGNVCENCLYILKTGQEAGLCPECGEPYGPESLAMWRSLKVYSWSPQEWEGSDPTKHRANSDGSRKF